MQQLEQVEDPWFSTLAEPQELQRLPCDHCRVALADVECSRCVQRFCRSCELTIHHRLEKLAMKNEESKGDGRPHQEFLQQINTCQVCGQNEMDFVCVDCNARQCEKCCVDKHVYQQPDSGHFYFCLEGSPAKILKFASWNTMYVELVKMCMGQLQDAETTTAAAGVQEVATSATDPQSAAGQIKLERTEAMSTSATAAALGNLSIDETTGTPQAQPQPPASQPKPVRRAVSTSVVDLTLDDDSDQGSTPVAQSASQPSQIRIKEEPRVKMENAWLNSAQQAFDFDELMEKAMGEDDDPTLRNMITDYNDLSVKIYEIEQESVKAREESKRLSSVQPINMAEVNKSRQKSTKLRVDKAAAEASRNSVVATVIMFIKPDPNELKTFLDTCVADVPPAQDAIHRKCTLTEASIRALLERIQTIRRNMDELMRMKKDASAEIMRLGAEMAAGEEEVRKQDKERLEEFLNLCRYSRKVQDAVRQMMSP